jgi:hypothetical protein
MVSFLKKYLELEVYNAWKETIYELLNDTHARTIEQTVIEKLAHVLTDHYSEMLKQDN